jgi:excisionase family DNA binding protein
MSTATEQPRLLRLPEAAARLDVSVETLRRRIAAGDIAAVRLGPSDRHPLRVSESELARFIGSSSEGVSDDGPPAGGSFGDTNPTERRGPDSSRRLVEPRRHGGEAVEH